MSNRMEEMIRSSLSSETGADERYSRWFLKIANEPSSVEALSAVLGILTDERSSQIVARHFLDTFVKEVKTLESEQGKALCETALNSLQVRTISFEAHVNSLKITLAGIHEAAGEWVQAARILNSITLNSNSGHLAYNDAFRLDIYMRICRLYLEADDHISAESSLNRATGLITQGASKEHQVSYKASHARILDNKRKYLEAGQKYHQMSVMESIQSVSEKSTALEKAINCAILAPAGAQRTRLIASIYKDDRSPSISSYALLEKVFRQRIINAEEVQKFSESLAPHHLAVTTEGWTLVERALKEHNIMAASILYKSISFANLGKILGISGRKAEQVASKMIQEQRLRAELDQVDEVVQFYHHDDETEWNNKIRLCCDQVIDAVDKIERLHPTWYEKNLSLINSDTSLIF